jgi:hypothetical protein
MTGDHTKELPQPEFYASLEQMLTWDEYIVEEMADLVTLEQALHDRRRDADAAFKARWSEYDARLRGATAEDRDILQTAMQLLLGRTGAGNIKSPREMLTDLRLFLGSPEAALSGPPAPEEQAAARAVYEAELKEIARLQREKAREWDERILKSAYAYVKWPFDGPGPNPRKPETFYKVLGRQLGAAAITWLADKGIEEAREQIIGPLSRRPHQKS